MKERIDKILHRLGHFESRKKAQVAIEKGLVHLLRQGQSRCLQKPSEMIEPEPSDIWRISPDLEFTYVSRAGAKLHGALEHFSIQPKAKICLDVGLSTGGFSDCLLQRGAKFILGVDVGTAQLHSKLKNHQQLLAVDKINAREPIPRDVMSHFTVLSGATRFDLMVFDVSFISVLKVLAAQQSLLSPQGEMLLLFKPQFEVGPEFIHKKGLVDAAEGLRVLQKTVKTIEGLGLNVIGTVQSNLKGEDGNQEHFIYARA